MTRFYPISRSTDPHNRIPPSVPAAPSPGSGRPGRPGSFQGRNRSGADGGRTSTGETRSAPSSVVYTDRALSRASGRGPRRAPLSSGHISPLTITLYQNAEAVELRGVGKAQERPACRGVVSGFSRKSRRRMMQKIGQVDTERVEPYVYFATLTYHNDYPDTLSGVKRDLDRMLKRLMRRGVQFCIWKLEPQRRGAPHFHLIISTADPLEREWFAAAWGEIAAPEDEEHHRFHLRAETFQPIDEWGRVVAYVSKYVAKVQTATGLPAMWDRPGRWWGVRGTLPATGLVARLSPAEFWRVRRLMRKALEKRTGRKYRSRGAFSGLDCRLGFEFGFRAVAWACTYRPRSAEWDRGQQPRENRDQFPRRPGGSAPDGQALPPDGHQSVGSDPPSDDRRRRRARAGDEDGQEPGWARSADPAGAHRWKDEPGGACGAAASAAPPGG